ncbi:MAG: GIY-YIG nuclease family protein [Gemella sp.]|nr:GIY-YIG nuclease family protein [Gemella sp.]
MDCKKHYTYILKCSDGTLYTGYTTNIRKRIETHNNKKGAKYTKTRTPVKLYYYEEFLDKSSAMKKEYAIKQLDRKRKFEYIDENMNVEKKEYIININKGEE